MAVRIQKTALIGGLAVFLSTRPLPAQQSQEPTQPSVPEWLERLTVEGRTYLRYSYELADSADNYNEFDIDRLYLQLGWRLSDRARIRYTLEGGDPRLNGTDQLSAVTKHLYLEVQHVLYPSTYLRFGLADLPWVGYEEGLWGYRLQGTVFADRSGYLTSTDLGVVLGGTIPRGYGSWHAGLVNGEGWKKNEVARHKDFHVRLTLNPLASMQGLWRNLFVAGFASVGRYDGVSAGPSDKDRFIAQLGYRSPERLTLVGEHLWASDPAAKMTSRYPSLAARSDSTSQARGFSVFGTLSLGALSSAAAARRWEALARWDRLDPDDQIAHNDLERWIVGVAYRWNRYVRSLLNYEAVSYQARALRGPERRAMLQAEIRF